MITVTKTIDIQLKEFIIEVMCNGRTVHSFTYITSSDGIPSVYANIRELF